MKICFCKAFIAIIVLLTVISGCGEGDEDSSLSPKDTETPSQKTSITNNEVYEQLASTLIGFYSDIYEKNITDVDAYTQNITNTGPMGSGNITVTGTTIRDKDYNFTKIDLSLKMNNVGYTYSYDKWTINLTISGITSYKGNIEENGDVYLTYASDSLQVKGSVSYDTINRSVNESGKVSITRITGKIVKGDLFGHPIEW